MDFTALIGYTSVVRIRRSRGMVVQDCDVYIGRRMTMGGWNLPQSKWANPYPVKQYGLDRSLHLYEIHVRGNNELMNALHELAGKRLGCWCGETQPCHGKVLIKLMKESSYKKGY